MWYPNCNSGYSAAGCNTCSPDCEDGMVDVGISCQKSSYGRGAGSVLVCQPGQEEDAGLCYQPCNAGYNGIGPVCWGSCPSGTSQCGALCLEEG